MRHLLRVRPVDQILTTTCISSLLRTIQVWVPVAAWRDTSRLIVKRAVTVVHATRHARHVMVSRMLTAYLATKTLFVKRMVHVSA
jgi:hypothetical protein